LWVVDGLGGVLRGRAREGHAQLGLTTAQAVLGFIAEILVLAQWSPSPTVLSRVLSSWVLFFGIPGIGVALRLSRSKSV